MKRLWLACGITTVVMALAPPPAIACSCVGGIPPCQQLWMGGDENPPVVFEATVVSIGEELGPPLPPEGRRYPIRKVTLKDARGWIGEPSLTIMTSGDGASCGYSFEVGRRYLIDAGRSPATGQLGTGLCSLTRPIEQAGEILAYLQTLSRPPEGATVSGTVHLMSGSPYFGPNVRTPVPFVRVMLHGPQSATTLSTDDGTFSFTKLPPGLYQLSVELEGQPAVAAPAPEEFRIPNAYACHRSWVNLTINGVIEGSILDGEGHPVVGASISLRLADPPQEHRVQYYPTASDELGRFSFKDLPLGRYQVGVNLNFGPRRESPFAVSLATGADGAPEIIELGPGALHQLRPIVVSRLERIRVQGQVVWADGRPAKGCLVSATPPAESGDGLGFAGDDTGEDGRFELDVLRGVRYRFRASNCTPMGAEVEGVGGDGFVQLVLRDRR